MSFNINEMKQRMQSTQENLEKEFVGLRTGRASTAMLDPVTVDVYGARMPLTQVATVGVPEARLLTVQVWDASQTKAVEKAIRDAGLGLNPQAEGTLIRVPVPELSTERRTELVKVAGKYAEAARVAIRNIRRDGMDAIKKLEKDKAISEDDAKRQSEDVQKATDGFIKKVDEILAQKEKDVMKV
ncbi:MAG: ribosome recycling factor [Micavibrio aeruginosavorus]|uniref:Ribosome-recycling factor n=1 Tax=Micavibrio aeruginosavorus TaxID=349221 RepID=A0A2W5HE65_9BACT|nr:MAG: ribosome recycling factor [Micavibrio aeruginosavorus]